MSEYNKMLHVDVIAYLKQCKYYRVYNLMSPKD